jgi:hypothetical protein
MLTVDPRLSRLSAVSPADDVYGFTVSSNSDLGRKKEGTQPSAR